MEETSYTEASALAKDEEWLNISAKTVDDETLKSLKKVGLQESVVFICLEAGSQISKFLSFQSVFCVSLVL